MRMKCLLRLISAGLIALSAPVFAAVCDAPLSVTSSKTRTVLAELYTSEGCNSCPPADKWFSTIDKTDKTIIPLAFHVDYWDYIGWKDRFAKPGFSARQREMASISGKRSVYTPQLLLNGLDTTYWHDARRIAASRIDANSKTSNVELGLRVAFREGVLTIETDVLFENAVDRKQSALFIAVTENNLATDVKAGENRGVSLRHDHVVRDLIGPLPLRTDGKNRTLRNAVIPADWKIANINVVAFVQSVGHGDVGQAVSTPLCRPPAG